VDARQDELSNPFSMDTECQNCPALADCREQVVHGYGDVGAEFVFVGEGEEEDAVAAAAERQENVYYPGSFEYAMMPGFMTHASAGFCFKDAEQPLKVMEYGAAGVVTIAQPGDLQTRLDDGEAVFIDPEPTEIANTLTELEIDEKRRETLAENLQQRARTESWRAVADEFYELLMEITSENPE